MTFNSKLLEEVETILDDIIAECYGNIGDADEKTTAKDIISKSFTKFLGQEKQKKQQGYAEVMKNQVMFEVDEGAAVPLFSEIYEDED